MGGRRWDGEISIGENPTRYRSAEEIKGELKIRDDLFVKSWLERFGVLKGPASDAKGEP